MLSEIYYAQNNAGIIGPGLINSRKIMDSIIRDQVYQYLTVNNLLVQKQYG